MAAIVLPEQQTDIGGASGRRRRALACTCLHLVSESGGSGMGTSFSHVTPGRGLSCHPVRRQRRRAMAGTHREFMPSRALACKEHGSAAMPPHPDLCASEHAQPRSRTRRRSGSQCPCSKPYCRITLMADRRPSAASPLASQHVMARVAAPLAGRLLAPQRSAAAAGRAYSQRWRHSSGRGLAGTRFAGCGLRFGSDAHHRL